MRLAASILLLVFCVVGCAISNRQQTRYPVSANWKKGSFRINFWAGPRGQDGRTYSFYEIKYTTKDQQEQSLVMGSAHSLWFGSDKNDDPKDFIRIIEDPNGKALLIEKEIPNDCGPCSNFLWVRLDSNGSIEGEYLKLPEKETGEHGGINYEYPKVRSLDGDILRYEYSVGDSITKRFNQIEKADSPTPPG